MEREVVGGVTCDVFSCYHLDGGPMEKVQDFITPYEPSVIKLAETLECDPYRAYAYVQAMQYVEPTDDTWQMPKETIRVKSGDCMDFTGLLTSILIYCGYKTWASLVYLPDSNPSEPQFHAYVEAVIDQEKVKLETTCPAHRCSFGQMPNVKMVKLLDFNDLGIIKKHV